MRLAFLAFHARDFRVNILTERWPSGLRRTPAKRVYPKRVPRVQIPLSPPLSDRAPVAQLDRAPDYGSGGWGFKSLRARHFLSDSYHSTIGRMKFPYVRQLNTVPLRFRLGCLISVNVLIMSCATTSTTIPSRRQAEEPQGFFASLKDQITERECNVGRFICPYGLGPAGEPCTCTDPSGIVLNGRTVK